MRFEIVDISKLKTSQMLRKINKEDVEGLAESIHKLGILQPPIAVKENDEYVVIAGNRRVEAAKLAEKKKIPVFVLENKKDDNLAIALVENMARKDLDPISIAKAIKKLRSKGWREKEIAQVIGRSKSCISKFLKLLELPQSIQDLLKEKKLSLEHAIELRRIRNEKDLVEVAEKIAQEGLSVKQTREFVRKYKLVKDVDKALMMAKKNNPYPVKEYKKTCWICGKEWHPDYIDFKPICIECENLLWPSIKKFRRRN